MSFIKIIVFNLGGDTMLISKAIKPYQKKDGKTYFKFKIYLGVDPVTHKEVITTRSGFTSEKKAQVAYTTLKYEFNKGLYLPKQKKTFNNIYEDWLTAYINTRVEKSTLSKTVGYFKNHILPTFGNMKIDKITVADCEKFGLLLAEKLQHFNHVYNYAEAVLTRAVDHDYLLKNPFTVATIPREKKKGQSNNYLLREDINKILEHMGNKVCKAYLLLRIYIFTGMRKSEALALSWDAIDFESNKINVTKALAYDDEKKKNKKDENKQSNREVYVKLPKSNEIRDIIIDSDTLDLLKSWKIKQQQELKINNQTNNKNLVFNGKNDNYLGSSTANRWLSSIIKKLDLKSVTVHGLRHSHATLLYRAKADLIGISHRLGHEFPVNTTTLDYIHITDELKLETLNCFLDYLKNG